MEIETLSGVSFGGIRIVHRQTLAMEVKCRMLAVSLSDTIDIVNFQLFYPTTVSIIYMGEGGWLWPCSHSTEGSPYIAFINIQCHGYGEYFPIVSCNHMLSCPILFCTLVKEKHW